MVFPTIGTDLTQYALRMVGLGCNRHRLKVDIQGGDNQLLAPQYSQSSTEFERKTYC